MSKNAWIIGATRTPIATENGKLAGYTAWELGQIVATSIIQSLRLKKADIDIAIFGNALYAGGNPTRLTSLSANIPISVPSMTIDTQCCSGMDAISHAAHLVKSGAYDLVIAGGAESHTTAPRRIHRYRDDRPDVEYSQPPFSPWPDKDPNMIEAAAHLASELKITRAEQEAFAVKSHATAMNARDVLKAEFVTNAPIEVDSFSRILLPKACSKLPLIAGDGKCGITAATAAVKADGAAVAAIVSDKFLDKNPRFREKKLRFVASTSVGCDPAAEFGTPVGQDTQHRQVVFLKERQHCQSALKVDPV